VAQVFTFTCKRNLTQIGAAKAFKYFALIKNKKCRKNESYKNAERTKK